VATLFATGQGLMDDVPVEDIKRFESEMIDALRAMPSKALKAIKETGALDDDTAATLKEEISSFKTNFWKGDEAPDSPAALAAEEEQEEVTGGAEAPAPEPEPEQGKAPAH
jgi:F-type H+-transporting ATPase subunit alpha